MKNVFLPILCIVALFVTWRIADRLVAVVEQTTTSHPVKCYLDSTNDCACASKSQAHNCAPVRPYDYEEALKMLRDEQNCWMTLLGIFCAIFGLLIPAGGYLLQRQSLKDEREIFRKMIDDETQKVKDRVQGELDALRERFSMFVGINDAKSEPFWNLMARTYERMLVTDAGKISGVQDPMSCLIANFLLELEHCLDASVRGKNLNEVRRVYETYASVINGVQRVNGQDWCRAVEMIKMNPDQLIADAKWVEYENVLKGDDALQWIKMLYAEFAPSKLEF